MKAITLTDVIKKNCKDKEFLKHFRRERVINEIAQMMILMRKKMHLTQKELATRAGTTQPVIARLESGSDKRIPSLELLTKIASAANANLSIKIEYNVARSLIKGAQEAVKYAQGQTKGLRQQRITVPARVDAKSIRQQLH